MNTELREVIEKLELILVKQEIYYVILISSYNKLQKMKIINLFFLTNGNNYI